MSAFKRSCPLPARRSTQGSERVRTELASLRGELDAGSVARSELERVRTELSTARAQVEATSAERSELARLQTEVSTARAKLEAVTAERAKFALAQTELSTTQAKLEAAAVDRAELAEVRAKLSAAEARLEAAGGSDAEIERLKARLAAAESRVGAATAEQIAQIQAELATTREALESATEKVASSTAATLAAEDREKALEVLLEETRAKLEIKGLVSEFITGDEVAPVRPKSPAAAELEWPVVPAEASSGRLPWDLEQERQGLVDALVDDLNAKIERLESKVQSRDQSLAQTLSDLALARERAGALQRRLSDSAPPRAESLGSALGGGPTAATAPSAIAGAPQAPEEPEDDIEIDLLEEFGDALMHPSTGTGAVSMELDILSPIEDEAPAAELRAPLGQLTPVLPDQALMDQLGLDLMDPSLGVGADSMEVEIISPLDED